MSNSESSAIERRTSAMAIMRRNGHQECNSATHQVYSAT
jgi:hypothetical protein